MKQCRFSGLLLTIWMLAGCSGEPSNDELKQAIVESNKQGSEAIKSLTGLNIGTEVHTVTKVACKPERDSAAYACEYQIESTLPVLGKQTTSASNSFIKTQNGWRVLSK